MTGSPMTLFLRSWLGISLSNSPFGCRILSFYIYSSALFVTLMLIFAAIDRFFASSSSAHLRNLSKVHVAQKVIIIAGIFTIIYSSPFIIIQYWDYTTNRCSQLSTTIIVLYLSSRVVIYYLMAPLTMAIFGLLTIYNIRSQKGRVAPAVINRVQLNHQRRRDGQLARMLIIQKLKTIEERLLNTTVHLLIQIDIWF
ncbi:unnamed protein product [Rotaria sordida]|uniref:G-protein coupled receptors family 1 profile domain-containing protein n=1 Tax=Rotaria sordida TaxID=392033 RepID=A0A815CHU5_9BILA|nr:unnamed protein product [Rotaria sordida]CAF1561428.1 unnamed protein product [Rotaria sordida]